MPQHPVISGLFPATFLPLGVISPSSEPTVLLLCQYKYYLFITSYLNYLLDIRSSLSCAVGSL